ncbi:MAG: hypothetical protein HFJ59_01165 [Clostridia bacterium]|nr:hypothetical protein [Clostridia bacterium]
MDKKDYIEMIQMSQKADEFVEQLFLDNGYTVQREIRVGKITTDIFAEKDEKKYVVEVKRGDLDTSKINGIANMLDECTKGTNYIPILVLFSRRSYMIKDRLVDNYNINVIDISNLLYLVSNNQKMKDRLINLLDFSTESIMEKELYFNIDLKQYKKCKESNYGYIEKLETIIAGKKNAQQYEKFCVDILKYLFNDTLSLWEEQQKSNDDLFRFDLICKIKNNINNEFFNTIENYFSSKYIIFEFKNYIDKITQKEVYTTEKYLYKTALRTVAILLTRNGVDKNGIKAMKGTLRENGKLIIVLDDRDIKQMIYAKEHGEDYIQILINKLDKMLVSLEK